jgi:hypothetical protein
MTENNPSPIPWKEEYSQQHIDTGRYFVPDRQVPIDIICTRLDNHAGARPEPVGALR